MHLRSSRIFLAALFLIFLVANAVPQSAAPAGDAFPSGIAQPASAPPARQDPAKPDPAKQDPPKQDPQKPETSPPAAPQEQSAPTAQEEEGGFRFHTSVEEVVLHATVVDDKQRMVTNLNKPDFTVLEDGKPQNIVSFRHEDIPVALGIVIDNSGSMREKRDKVNKAAINLVKASNPQDEVFIVNFNDEYYLDQDFTADIGKMKEALEKVDTRGGTALYDAVVASAGHLKKNAKLEKRVLLVVTDGEDNESQETLEQAIRRLQEENGPTVYAIGLLGEEKARRARKRSAVHCGEDRRDGLFSEGLGRSRFHHPQRGARHPQPVHAGVQANESEEHGRVSHDSRGGQGQGLRKADRTHQERVLRGAGPRGGGRRCSEKAGALK